MNKTELKKFAVEARRDLMAKVSLKAEQYGITKDNQELKIEENYGQLFINDNPYPIERKHAFHTLQQRLKTAGYDQLIEEVAYTWFNRIIAIRYMEVNNYLPDRVNVLSSSTGKTEPDILLQYETMDLNTNRQEINEWLKKGDNEQAYRKLFVAQCNSLNNSLPTLFEKINDYTELLLPDYLLDSEFIISKLVNNQVLTDNFGEVEVIGWIYQYYNSEPKDKVFSNLKKNKKVEKYDIPAATQLFTPKWIVKYMVENSLGDLWLKSYPDSPLKDKMQYNVSLVNQDEEVQNRLQKAREKSIDLESVKILDPCVGSGHILVYAFEILYQMYEEAGYPRSDIPKIILEKNLYGIDIDNRASQLASFALLMKAREKSRKILKAEVKLNVFSVQESNDLDNKSIVDLLAKNQKEENEIDFVLNLFLNAKNIGSLLRTSDIDLDKYINRLKDFGEEQLTLESYQVIAQKEELIQIFMLYKLLNSKFDVVVTNPPYMGARGMNTSLKNYLKDYYDNSKSDTFSAFIERAIEFSLENGYVSMITMESWMFLTKFEKLRKLLLNNITLLKLLHMPYEGRGKTSLGINFGSVAFVMKKNKINHVKGNYQCLRYFEIDNNGEPHKFPIINNRYRNITQEEFDFIDGSPIAYWMNLETRNIFKNSPKLESKIDITGSQHKTANNEKYLRYFWEIDSNNIGSTWVQYAKGGEFRRWYGNNELTVDWSREARKFYQKNKTSNLLDEQYRFRKGITWTASTNGKFSARELEGHGLFDMKGPALFPLKEEDQNYILGYLNSKPVSEFLDMFSGASDYQNIDIKRLPYIMVSESTKVIVNNIVKENLKNSKEDWDYHETSPGFESHPYLKIKSGINLLEEVYEKWSYEKEQKWINLKENEEQINKVFINLYGLDDELDSNVEDNYISISKANRDRDTKSFLSYFIGCFMGRFSLDVEGLVYAGGKYDESNYKTFKPNKNGLIQLTDKQFFDNDIITRLRNFLSMVYSPHTVEENMRWLAESLTMKKNESPDERLRRYFLDEFFNDHCKTYQKRPIYWLVDSGKQKGLRTLIYMHKYQPDTMATIRFEHLQEIQSKYQNEIDIIDKRLANPSLSASDKRILEKSKSTYQKKIEELQDFDKKLAAYANEQIEINLDDGVIKNYGMFDKVLAKIK